MEFDITNLAKIIISLCAALFTSVVFPYMKAKMNETEVESTLKWVKIAVFAAEQVFSKEECEQKKEYVVNSLLNRGVTLDEQQLDDAIEAAVLELHNSLEA